MDGRGARSRAVWPDCWRAAAVVDDGGRPETTHIRLGCIVSQGCIGNNALLNASSGNAWQIHNTELQKSGGDIED